MSSVSVPSPAPDRALTAAQKRALLALAEVTEASAAQVAEATTMKPNGAALALRGLERRGLVARADEALGLWSVTFAGRALLKRLASNGARPGDGTSGSSSLPSDR